MPLAGSIKNYPPLWANQDGYNSRYTSSLTVALGSVTFTVQPAKAYGIGTTVMIYNAPTKWMTGNVTAYDPVSGSLTVNVIGVAGTGSASDWYISLTGVQGPQGVKGDNAQATGSATATGDITLTTAVSAVQVNPTGPGFFATLPAGTSFPSKMGNAYNIMNISEYDYGVRDSTGKRLGWIRGKTGTNIGCIDNTTAAGVWSLDNVVPYGVVGRNSNVAFAADGIISGGSVNQKFNLDNNRELVVYATGSPGSYLMSYIVYDKTTRTFGNPVMMANTVNTFSIVRGNSNNQVIVFLGRAGQALLNAYVIDVFANGSTNVGVNGSTAISAEILVETGEWGNLRAVKMGTANTYAVIFTESSTNSLKLCAVTVGAGTNPVVTFGSWQGQEALASSSTQGKLYKKIYAISPTVGAFAYCQNADGLLLVKPFTISGSTLTIQAGGSSSTSNLTGNWWKFYDQLPDGRIPIIFYNTSSTYAMYFFTVAVDGLTVSQNVSGNLLPQGGAIDTNHSDFWIVNSTKMYFLSRNTSNVYSFIALTTSGGAITTTGMLSLTSVKQTSYAQNSGSQASFLYCDDTTIRAVIGPAVATLTVSGTSANFSEMYTFPNFNQAYIPNQFNYQGIRDPRVLLARDNSISYIPNPAGAPTSVNIFQSGYSYGRTVKELPIVGSYAKGVIAGDQGEYFTFSPYAIEKVECI